MGAKAMAIRWQPDVIIVVDVDFASDDPGMDAKKLGGEVKLGAGPVIHRGAAGNLALTDLAIEVAKDEGIPVQVKAMPGSTSTDAEELMAAGTRGDAVVQHPGAQHALGVRGHRSRTTPRPARCWRRR